MNQAKTTNVSVLDHGYVRLVDAWGREEMESSVGDESIIAAARMSTDKGFEGWGPSIQCRHCGSPEQQTVIKHGGCGASGFDCQMGPYGPPGDEKLLRFLWENKHATPFEMAGITIEVQAPIFVFREWHRHRVPFGYNEMSARYTPLPDVNYIPSVERLMLNAGTSNKQAGTIKDSDVLTKENAERFRRRIGLIYSDAQQLYEDALASGVPKELARVHLPVGRYSRMRATGNLRGWLGFLTLRMAPNAQWEIRQFANAVGDLIAHQFPRTWALFIERKSR